MVSSTVVPCATTARTITGHAGEAVVALDADAQVLDLVPAAARPGDLLLMLGAGDIVETTPALLAALEADPRDRA